MQCDFRNAEFPVRWIQRLRAPRLACVSKQRLANPLRNLLFRHRNSSTSFLRVLRRNIDNRTAFRKNSINTVIFIENIVISG